MVNPASTMATPVTVSPSDPATGVSAMTSVQAMANDFNCRAM